MFRTKILPFMLVMMFMLSSFGLMIPNVSAAPTVVYTDDFESGITKWDDGFPTYILISTAQAHGGTHSLKMTSSGGVYYENHTLGSATSYPFQGEIWFYADALTSGSRFMIYGLTAGSGLQAFPNFFVYNDSGTIRLQVGENFGGWSYASLCTVTLDAWYHVYFNATAFDRFKLWVNDVPYGFFYASSSIGMDAKKLCTAKTTGTGTVYVDDFLIETGGVDPVGWPPTITSTPATIATNGHTYYYNITVNESCTYVVDDYPAWANITDPTHIHGIPTVTGHYDFNISATSVAGTGVKKQTWSVYSTPVTPWAPTITSGAPASIYAHHDQVWYYNMTTNESCTYMLMAGSNAGVLNTANGHYYINLSSAWRTYWGVPAGISGPYLTVIRATSTNGTLYDDRYFNVTFTPNEWMPTFISSPSSSGRVGTTYYYNSSLNESCTYIVSTYPAWANITDPTHIHGIPTLYGAYSFVLKARSVNGTLTRTQSWTVTVVNASTWAPTITSTPITKMIYGARYYYNITLNESASVIWLQIWTTPGGYTLINGNKNYAWTPFAAGTYHFSVRATSVNGSESVVQSWDLVVLAHGWFTTVTSSPVLIGYANHSYWYNITTNESCTVTIDSDPAWAWFVSPVTNVYGIPTVQGYYTFSYRIVSTGGLLTTWHNWTVHILIENPWAPTFMSIPTTRILHTPTANWYYNITLNSSCTILYYVGPSWVLGTGIHPDGNVPSTYFNISGHPEVGVWQFAILATSVDGMLSTFQWWNVTVLATGWAPVITSVPAITAYTNVTYYYDLTTNESVSITWVTYPAWMNVLVPTHIFGAPYYISSYTMKATVYSLSGLLYVNQTWIITTLPPILWSPVITSTPITTAQMGSVYYYNVTTNETCTFALLAYLNAASINANSGVITMDLTPTSVQYWGVFAGTYLFQVAATSTAGHGTVTQTWYVVVSGHEWLPSFTCTPITNIRGGETYTLLITVNESCTIDGLDIPTWLTLTNDGQLSSYQHWLNGTAPADNGTFYVRIRAISVLGNEAAYLSYNVQVIRNLPITPSSGAISFLMTVSGMMTLLCLPIAATYWKYGDDSRKAALWIVAFLIFGVMFFSLIGA